MEWLETAGRYSGGLGPSSATGKGRRTQGLCASGSEASTNVQKLHSRSGANAPNRPDTLVPALSITRFREPEENTIRQRRQLWHVRACTDGGEI